MINTTLPSTLVHADVDLPTSRAVAVERGAVRYFSGQPCPTGHVAARYTLSGYCVQCQLIATRRGKQAAKARRGGT